MLVFEGSWVGDLKTQDEEVTDARWFSLHQAQRLPLAFTHNDIVSAYASRPSKMSLLPHKWETQRLTVEDSTRDEVPELQEVADACRYIEEWTGWRIGDHPEATMPSVFTDGELPPNGCRDCFKLQSIHLRDTRQVIGFLEAYHGFPMADTFWVHYLAIHPRYQGQGYGQDFVQGLGETIRGLRAYTGMELTADLKNWPALRFWVQAGSDRIANVQGDKVYSAETFAHLTLQKSVL